MISQKELERYQRGVAELFQRAHIVITPDEAEHIEIADFGLGQFEQTGLGVLVYVNTRRCCAKELAMWPRQTCPEHRHPAVDGKPGKEETFRCRWGRVFLYVEGTPAKSPALQAARRPRKHLFHLARGRTRPGRTVHRHAGHEALVPGRRRGRDRFRVLDP